MFQILYVFIMTKFTDRYNYRIRKILANGMIKTIAGTGSKGFDGDGVLAINSKLSDLRGLYVDENSQVFFVENDRIRKIDRHTGLIYTIIGTGISGYSGDIPFDFNQFPHLGPKRKADIKPFPKACYDLLVKYANQDY